MPQRTPTPTDAHDHARSQRDGAWKRWLLSVSCMELVLAIAIQAAPLAPWSPTLAFVIAFSAVSASSILTSAYTPVTTPRALVLLLVVLPPLLWLRSASAPEALAPYVVTACLLFAGTLIGSVIGSRVQAVSHLLFVAIVSSAADIFSVYAPDGPTHALIAAPEHLSLLALPWPMLGTPDVVPLLGVGDVVFASLYATAARAHQLSLRRTWVALSAGFALTLAILLVIQAPIPALPMLGLAFVVAHPAVRRVDRGEAKRAWIGVSALLLLLALIAAYRH